MGFHRIRVMVSRSTHVAEQHLFPMFPSILTFNNFDLILGVFWDFCNRNQSTVLPGVLALARLSL